MGKMTTVILATDPKVATFLKREHELFVGGEWVASAGTGRIEVFDPASGEVIATVPRGNAEDVDRAVRAAHKAFEQRVWSGLPPTERERILLRFADLVEANAEELAQIETRNQGKSINISRMMDTGLAPGYMRYVAGLATKVTGQTYDISAGAMLGCNFTTYTRREPVGVVAAITPWNFPMFIGLWKIMPALAAGCTMVIKPSEVTPLSTIRLIELAAEAGIPDGVLNLITGDGSAGKALVGHPLVSKVTFTGSTATGKSVARGAAERLLRVSLELGGKNPAIFLKDTPVEKAIGGAIMGGFLNNGQVCASSSRLYVAREIYSDFVAGLSQVVNGMTIGPGMDPTAQVNAVVSAAHRTKILTHIEQARKDGARIVAGGEGLDQPGYYVRPTVIVDAPPSLDICRQEVFGPLVVVTPFDDEEEVIRLANDTDMGLTASLWTNDLKKTLDYVPRLKAGLVYVNTHNVVDPAMPFGGFKESGIGRDFGVDSLDGYTEIKSVCIAH